MIRFECSDCMDYLKTVQSGSVSLVLTDPPYEISRKTNFASGLPKGKDTDRFRMSMEFGEWDTHTSLDFPNILKEFYRVLKNGGTLIMFFDLWKITPLSLMYKKAGFKQLRFIEWVKTNPVPLNSHINYLTNAREVALVGVKGTNPIFNSQYDNGIYCYPINHSKDRWHPTQKPVSLLRDLVSKHSNRGDLVLDCFSGGASTLMACCSLERDFAGCELDKEYYENSLRILKESGIYLNNKDKNNAKNRIVRSGKGISEVCQIPLAELFS